MVAIPLEWKIACTLDWKKGVVLQHPFTNLSNNACHPPALLRTLSAGVRTFLAMLHAVLRMFFTFGGAGFADVGANAANIFCSIAS